MLDTQEQEEQGWEYWLNGHDFILNWFGGTETKIPLKQIMSLGGHLWNTSRAD